MKKKSCFNISLLYEHYEICLLDITIFIVVEHFLSCKNYYPNNCLLNLSRFVNFNCFNCFHLHNIINKKIHSNEQVGTLKINQKYVRYKKLN